jgi:HlyD family secretion protein
VILARNVEVGQTVQSSQSVKSQFFTVAADLSQIEIEAAVVRIRHRRHRRRRSGRLHRRRFRGRTLPGRGRPGAASSASKQANVVTYTVVVNARNPNGKLLPGMTANVEITADRVTGTLRVASDATRFQPPKEIMDAMRAEAERNGQGGGQGGPGNGQGGRARRSPGGGGAQTVGFR